MGKRRIVQHTSGGTHCHGGGRRECPRQMRRERRSALCTLPWLLHADKARRLSIFNISWSGVAPPTSAAVASRPTESTRAKTNSVRAQAADLTSQDALVCIRIFIEQALTSRCGCMQDRQRVRTLAKNTCTNNDMRMLISRWTACSLGRSNEGFLRILLRVFRIVRLECVLLVDLLPLRTLLLGQRSHRVDAGDLNETSMLSADGVRDMVRPGSSVRKYDRRVAARNLLHNLSRTLTVFDEQCIRASPSFLTDLLLFSILDTHTIVPVHTGANECALLHKHTPHVQDRIACLGHIPTYSIAVSPICSNVSIGCRVHAPPCTPEGSTKHGSA